MRDLSHRRVDVVFSVISMALSSESCCFALFPLHPPARAVTLLLLLSLPLSFGIPPHGVTSEPSRILCLFVCWFDFFVVHWHLSILHCHSVWLVPWLPLCWVSWLVYRDCQPQIDCLSACRHPTSICNAVVNFCYTLMVRVYWEPGKTSYRRNVILEEGQISSNKPIRIQATCFPQQGSWHWAKPDRQIY